MTRIQTSPSGSNFHQIDTPDTDATHVKPTVPPPAPPQNVVDAFVASDARAQNTAPHVPAGRSFSVAELERMSPEQRAESVGSSVVRSAVYPAEELETFPLKEKTYREQLVTRVVQTNDVSAKTLNGPDICAACAVVNAMILSDHPAASAKALGDLLKNTHAKLPAPLRNDDAARALKALRSGEVSEFDVAVLQQVAAAVLEKMQHAEDQKTGDRSPGVSPHVLKSFVEALTRAHAPLSGTTFEPSETAQGAHWTVTRNGVHADSAPGGEPRKRLGSFIA